MQALVSAGMGVTLIPDLALMLPSPDIALVEVVPDPPVRRVWAATLDAGARSLAAAAMVETLAAVGAESRRRVLPAEPERPGRPAPASAAGVRLHLGGARCRAAPSRGRGTGRRASVRSPRARFMSCHIATYSWKAARTGLNVWMFFVSP